MVNAVLQCQHRQRGLQRKPPEQVDQARGLVTQCQRRKRGLQRKPLERVD